MTSIEGTRATLDHYLRVAFGDLADRDYGKAAELAAANVHEPVQLSLAELGQVEVLTEEETADTGCEYRVHGLDDTTADVNISTVLPYAAIVLRRGGEVVGYLTEVTDGWEGEVVRRVAEHGVFVLSSDVCRAASPAVDPFTEEFLTYYEVLFGDEHGTP